MQVQEGEGWRLTVDPLRRPFLVLIGGSGWAAELSAPEAEALRRGVARLVAQHRQLVDTLLAEEVIALELEMELAGGGLWLGLEGDRQVWSLRFVLTPPSGQRGLEGAWSAGASAAMAAALEMASPFADRGAAGADSG
ncbi:MAG: DUF1818 family protein [Cyanobium sp.]